MNIGVEAVEATGSRVTLRGLRRSALPIVGGLALLAIYILVAVLFIEGLIVLFSAGAPSDASGEPSLGLPWLLTAMIVALVAVALVFAAGLVDLLVQSSRSGRGGSIGFALTAFRSTHWLLLAALIAAPLVAVISEAATTLWLTMVEVLVLAEILLVYGIYTVPLILDRRLNTLRALAESARLARRGGFVRQYVVLVVATLATIGFWRVVGPRIVAITWEYSWEPHLANVSSWVSNGGPDEHSLLGLTLSAFLILLCLSLAAAATCGAWAGVLAGMYLRVRRFAAAGDSAVAGAAAPSVAPRTQRRLLAGVAAALVLMVAAAGFLWWYATPPVEQTLAPGKTVGLRNGLTLTVPAGAHAGLFPTRKYPSWLGLGDNGGLAVLFFQGPFADAVAWNAGAVIVGSYSPDATPSNLASAARHSPLIGKSADGNVGVYWKSGSRYGFVLTHLPGQLDGFVQMRVTDSWRDPRPMGPSQAMEGLTKQWFASSLTGAQLPAQTSWRSQTVAPGQRATLSSGLSLVMPHRWLAELASTTLSAEPAQMFMPLTLHPRGAWYGEVLSLRGESDQRLDWATDRGETRLVARSADGTVEVYGPKPIDAAQVDGAVETGAAAPHDEWVTIVVRLPGHAVGFIRGYVMTNEPDLLRADAWRFARRMWTAYQVEGATLPLLSGD
jgi:hypothetical protein